MLKPTELRTDTHYWETFGEHSLEAVARNIVVFTVRDWGGEWVPFTVAKYHASYGSNGSVYGCLETLVKGGYLTANGTGDERQYSVTKKFVYTIAAQYAKE